MDRVLAICENYAILEKGNLGTAKADKELKSLIDIKFGTDKDYLEKQVKPHLQSFGRRLAIDVRYHPLTMTERGLPDDLLKRFGYYEYANEHSGLFYLNRLDKTDNNTYAVPLRGLSADNVGVDAGGYALSQLQEAMIYAARLALISESGSIDGFPVTIDNSSDIYSIAYFHDVPIQFWHSTEWIPITNVFDFSSDAIIETHGVIARDGTTIAVRFDHFNSAAKTENQNTAQLAASLLLICLERTYQFGRGYHAVNASTGKIVKQEPTNLLTAIIDFVASGKVHECPHCKRPIFGTSKFCRHGGCYQRMSEKVQAQLEIGLSLKDAIEKYGDFFGQATIENWAKREGR